METSWKDKIHDLFERTDFSGNIGDFVWVLKHGNDVSDVISFIEQTLESEREKLKETEKEPKVEMYQCQSYVEGGKVKDCTCGECF